MARLPDIVASGKRKANESINVYRNPKAALYRFVRRVVQNAYESAELFPDNKEDAQSRQSGSLPGPVRKGNRKTGSHYASSRQVLTGSRPIEGIAETVYTEIKSRWDRYILEKEPLEEGENFFLYRAKANSSDTYVQVKEYTLTEQFLREKELFRRQQWFEQLIHQNRKISHSPDFRLVKLLDGIYDRNSRRCYLVTKPFEDTLSLGECLDDISQMDAFQIREVLRQVLETLQFLHNACWIRFPSGKQIKGIPHANLNLSSLLIRRLKNPNTRTGEEFFVYVADLGLWEHLFLPPGPEQFYADKSLDPGDLDTLKQKDLQDLCRIAYQLAGGSLDWDGNPQDFSTDFSVGKLHDKSLGDYLKGLWNKDFPSAWKALEALQILPDPEGLNAESGFEEEDNREDLQRSFNWIIPILVLILSVGGVSFVVSKALINHVANHEADDTETDPRLDNLLIRDVTFTDSIAYGVEADSAWETAMDRPDPPRIYEAQTTGNTHGFPTLMSLFYVRHQNGLQETPTQTELRKSDNSKDSEDSKTIQQISARTSEGNPEKLSPRKSLELVSLNDSLKDYSELSRQIEDGIVDVGLVERLPSESLPGVGNKFKFETVAYDGLAVFVPFGDAYRSRNSIGKLGHNISLNDLRRLYTGFTDEPQLRGQTVKLFFPNDETVIDLFKALVLNNDPDLVSRFDALHQSAIARDVQVYSNANRSDSQTSVIRNNIYEKLLHEFEANDTIGIGFDRLSHMYNQCSVYPLAVSAQNLSTPAERFQPGQNQAIQPLKQSGGRPIQPTTDLCNAKGSYWLEISAAYPLQVELGVLHAAAPEAVAGQEFLAMLNTVEGQLLLSQAGLVPKTIPMEHIWQKVWGGE